jgi:hypothetical protein
LRTVAAWFADREEDITSTLVRKLVREDPCYLRRGWEVLTPPVRA